MLTKRGETMANSEIDRMVVTIDMNSQGFVEGVSAINRQIAIVKKEFQVASAQAGGFGNSTDQLKLKADSLAKQLDLQRQKVAALSRAYEESRIKSGENTKATDNLRIKLLSAQKQEANLNNQLKQVNSELKNQNKAFGNASTGASGFSRILQNAFSVTLGMGFFDMIKSGFNYAKEAAFEFNSSLQQNTIAFTTLMGSAEKANEYIQWMMEYSSKTPFEFQDLAEGSRLLMAFGFEAEKIPSMLEAIGNAASGLGMKGSEGLNRIGLQLGQINTLGKASYQDLKQLAQAGIPVWDILAQAIGKTTGEIQEMATKGLLPAQETIDVLIAGMNEQFGGMMEQQSKTWQGLTSSIKDNLSIAFGTMTEGVFQEASGMLESISEKLENFNAVARDQGLRAALETLIPKPLVDSLAALKNGFEWIAEHGTVVKASLIGIAAGFAAIKLAKLLTDTERMITLWNRVTDVFTASNAKIVALGAVVAILAGTAYLLYRNWEHVAPFFSAMWDVITDTFETGKNAVIVALRGLQVGVAEVLNFTLGNVSDMVAGMLGIFAKIPKIGDEFAKAQSAVKSFSNTLGNFVVSSKKSLNQAVAQTKVSAGMISGNFELMKQAGSRMVDSIGDDLSGLINKAKSAFTGVNNAVNEGLDTSTLTMEEAGENLANAIGNGMEKGGKSAGKKAKQTVEGISDEIETAIYLIDREIKKLLEDSSDLEIYQDNLSRAMQLTADKIKLLIDEYNRLSQAKNVNKNTLQQLIREIDNAKDAYDELGKKIVDVTEQIKQANIKTANDFVEQIKDALKRRYEEERDIREKELDKEIEALDKWKDESIDRINDVYDKKIKAIEDSEKARKRANQNREELNRIAEIKARLQELSRMTIEDLETEEDKVEEVYNKRIKLIEEAKNAQIKAINEEIAAIDNLLKEEERADKDTEELKRINQLKSAIEFEHNEYNKAEMKKQLDNLVAEREKRLRREQLEEQKEELIRKIDIIQSEADEKISRLEEEKQNQIEQIRFQERINQERIRLQDELNNIMKAREERAYEESIELQIQKLQEQQENEINNINTIYEAHKLDLEQRLADIKEFYKIRLEDAQLQAEAEQMIMKNNQEAIIDLLYQYTDHYKAVGQTFGDKMVEGFAPMIDEIHSMIDNVLERISAARSAALSIPVPEIPTSTSENIKVNREGRESGKGTLDKPKIDHSRLIAFNTTINSPIARTPSQERREWERTNRNMIFQAGLA